MIIKAIYDDDYGCEERAEDAETMCIVLLTDENGREKEVRVAESFLAANSLDEGSVFPDEY